MLEQEWECVDPVSLLYLERDDLVALAGVEGILNNDDIASYV
jgi:hypothetical protein